MSRSSDFSRLRDRFDQLAAELRRSEYKTLCLRPLAHWTSLSDRSVPFVLLERSVRDIVHDGFEAAASQPGVGAKKLGGLLVLLERVTASEATEPLLADDPSLPSRSVFSPDAARLRHNARGHAPLREVDWDVWRRTVVRRRWDELPVGRCLARLRDLPVSNWNKPLRYYAGCTVRQLFALPLHGNHRVAAVVDACRRLAEAPETIPCEEVGRPALVLKLLQCLADLHRPELVRRRTVGELSRILMRQIEHDLGPQAADVFSRLTDAKSNVVRLSGWNRHYRRSIRLLVEVRCPELFLQLDELTIFSVQWPPLQQRSIRLLRDVLTT